MLIHDSLSLLSCGFFCLEYLPSTTHLENSKLHLSKFHPNVSFSRKLSLTCRIPVRVNHFIFRVTLYFFPLLYLSCCNLLISCKILVTEISFGLLIFTYIEQSHKKQACETPIGLPKTVLLRGSFF